MRLLCLPLTLLLACDEAATPAAPVLADEKAAAEAIALAAPHFDVLLGSHAVGRSGALRVSAVEIDELAMRHVRTEQRLGGLPVFGGEAIVSFDEEGELAHIVDTLAEVEEIDTRPAYAADEAVDLAIAAADLTWLDEEPAVRLVVLPHGGRTHLAYEVRLRDTFHGEPTMPRVFIDAHTGETIWQYEDLRTATGDSHYYGTVSFTTYKSGADYYLEDTTRDIGTFSYAGTYSSAYYITDTDTVWTEPDQLSGVTAHYAARTFYNYFKNTHARQGIDGANGPGYVSSLTGTGSVVSLFVNYGSNYVNAYWDGTAIYVGDGDGVDSDPLVTVDIIGHEMTHGITTNEANFTYYGESGALDESYADVFGTMVELYSGQSPDWALGEDCWTPSVAGDALRYMSDPTADGSSTEHYSTRYTGSADSAGVHINSGIGNLAFYLMAQGGAHPTTSYGSTTVTAIGTTKAAAIWYRALTTYLTASATFATARTAQMSAASDLYGTSSTEYATVQNAWAAVGVGSAATTSTCSGYTTTLTGTISTSGTFKIEPSGTYYVSSTSGTHKGKLVGPSGTNFDLRLQKWVSGTGWTNVAMSNTTGTSNESVSYSGTAANYRYVVKSTSGTGAYTFCMTKP
jgi:Zn-dependent metalloprotease